MRTLLVEDNPADTRLVREMLSESPGATYACEHAGRLDAATERVRREKFDVVLLDLGLPDSQGIGTLVQFQKAGGGLPIVVLTGLNDEAFALRTLHGGAQDYLIKGRFDSEQLVRSIRYAVERKKAEQALKAERQRFFDVLETMPAMICLLTPDYHVAFANRAFREKFGEAEGRHCYEYCFGRTAPCEFCESFTALQTGRPHRYEVHSPDGSVFDVHDIPFTDADGTRMVLEMDLDITERKRSEAALRESEKEFRSLAEAMPQIVWACQPDGQNIYFNHQWMDYTGLTLAESRGPNWIKPFHPDDQPRAWTAWERATKHRDTYSLECRLRRADGVYRWWLIRGVPFCNDRGEVLKWFGTCTNIEDLKRAEEQIRQLNAELEKRVADRTAELNRRMAELQTIFETVPVGLAIADDPKGRHIRGNPTIEHLTGAGPTGELSLTANRPPPYRARGAGGRELPPEELPMQRACRGETVTDWIMEIERPNGELSVLQSNATPLRDENGELRGAVGAFMDITGLKRAEAALQQERDRLAALIASVRDEIWFADSAGRFTLMNPAACREFNLEPNARLEIRELATRLEVFRADGSPRPAEEAPPLRALRGETVTNLEEVIRMPGTSQMRYREVSAAPVRDNTGQIIGSVSVVRDITERKQAEAALRESEELRRAIMDNSPDAIYVKDRQSRWLMGNPEVLRIVRKTAEQVTGKTDLELYDDPTIGRAILENDRRIMQNGKSETFEEVADTPEGRRTFQSTKAPRRDTQGNIIGLIGVSRDITEQKKAELALTKQREELQLILDSCPAFIFYKDRENRFLRVNQAFANALQMQKAALDGRSLFDLFPREQAEVYWKDDQEVMASGKPKLAILEQMQTPEGRRWMQTDKVPSHDSTGNVNGIIGFAVDITDRKQAEEALRQSELRFHTIYDTAPVSIWQEDWTEVIALIENLRAEGVTDFGAWFAGHPEFVTRALAAVKILDVNQWTLDMFQARDKAELLASLGTVFATPDTRPGFIGELVALVQGQAIYRTEMALNTVGGNQIYGLLAMSFPPPDSDSGSVLVSVIDITERKTAEEALRLSEQKFSSAFHGNAAAMVLTRIQDDCVLDANDAWLMMVGLSREQVVGRTVRDTGIWKDLPSRAELLQELKQTGSIHNRECAGVHSTGREFSFLLSARMVTLGEEQFAVGSAIDITSRKEMEEALRRSEERFKAIASHTPDHILVQNRDLRYELVINPQIGLTEQDMIGKTDHDFLKPADANKLTRIKRQVLETGQPVHVEEPLMSPAGEQRFFEGTYVPRFNARGLVDGLIGYFRDTTERKRVEEQIRQLNAELRQRAAELEAANKELEAFAYSVSHDLRAPLRAIDGFSRILLEDHAAQLNDQGRDSLRRVCDATRRMGQLIDDLLNLSRVIRSEMRRGPVDLSAAAARIAEELRQSDPARAVEFKIQPGLKAEGDANLLRLVLENLLGNAWKFTAKQPAPVIEFGAMLRDDVPAFFVRDNGAGFDMAFAGKLFGAFQRLHSTADFPGTGIGLATVQRIIRRHGGQVTAEGAVGRGATFTFTLQPQPP